MRTVLVAAVDVLVDKAAEEVCPQWRKRFKEWEKVGSDFGYHCMGSTVWFSRIGKAFGEATLELIGARKQGARVGFGAGRTRLLVGREP